MYLSLQGTFIVCFYCLPMGFLGHSKRKYKSCKFGSRLFLPATVSDGSGSPPVYRWRTFKERQRNGEFLLLPPQPWTNGFHCFEDATIKDPAVGNALLEVNSTSTNTELEFPP